MDGKYVGEGMSEIGSRTVARCRRLVFGDPVPDLTAAVLGIYPLVSCYGIQYMPMNKASCSSAGLYTPYPGNYVIIKAYPRGAGKIPSRKWLPPTDCRSSWGCCIVLCVPFLPYSRLPYWKISTVPSMERVAGRWSDCRVLLTLRGVGRELREGTNEALDAVDDDASVFVAQAAVAIALVWDVCSSFPELFVSVAPV